MSEPEETPGSISPGRETRYLMPVVIPLTHSPRIVRTDRLAGLGGAAPATCSLYDSGMCRRNANPGQTTDTLPRCTYPLHAEKCPDRPTQAQ